MKTTKIFLATFLVIVSWPSHAHELATHAAITYNAFLRSKLNPSDTLVQDLGILNFLINPGTSSQPFGKTYYDIQGVTINERYGQPFENKIIVKDLPEYSVNELSLPGWLMRGAIREDDGGYLIGNFIRIGLPEEPYDDPDHDINRWCNHFFDPLKNRAATFRCPIAQTEMAVNWAIGTNNAFATQVAENASRRNHFTVYDAREAMYRALTGQKKDGTNLGNNGYAPANEDDRKKYWATLFRALGDILHLNQDMAQPQHTRDESHAGFLSSIGLNIKGNPVYEKYTDARAKRAVDYPIDGTPGKSIRPLVYSGYAAPTFNKFSDFWSTGTGSASLSGKGLADYTNHGFFTIDNNIGGINYDFPSPFPTSYTKEPTLYPPVISPRYIMNYLKGQVHDNLTDKNDNIKMVRESMWKDFSTSSVVYTMDRNNFDDMADLLIPRAVGYSVGIINYFFRGKMEISLPDQGVYSLVDHSRFAPGGDKFPTDKLGSYKGFDKIKLKIKNTTTAITPPGGTEIPQTMDRGTSEGTGRLVAVVKFRRDTCYKDDLSDEPIVVIPFAICHAKNEEEIVVSSPAVDANGLEVKSVPSDVAKEVIFNFSDKQIPINAADVYIQVVYRGPLGSEDDAVVRAIASKVVYDQGLKKGVVNAWKLRFTVRLDRGAVNGKNWFDEIDRKLFRHARSEGCWKNGSSFVGYFGIDRMCSSMRS